MEKKHIIFRDSLKKDKYLADEYARIKTELAESLETIALHIQKERQTF
jgi:GrpB-like predicted nucleotidyltransferase (UPF0157 family)